MALWVAAVAQRRRVFASLLSMACGSALLFGIDRIVDGGWLVRGCWLLGYGAGTFLAVTFGKGAVK
jgi:hypothetical protein